jgi:hypothetical protein
MKTLKLITIIFAINFGSLWAADSSVTTTNANTIQNETNNNKVLYNNAEATSGTAKDNGYLKVLGSESGGATKEMNLTDEQKQLSESFVHQGLANRKILEACSGEKNQAMCAGNDPEASKKALVQGISKAYAMFSGMMDDKFLGLKKKVDPKDAKTNTETKPETDAKTADGKKTEGAKEESQTDYCKYIPMATETISMFMQQSNAQLLQTPSSGGETAQKESILKAAKSHEERAKGSKIQATGWGGTAACYGVMAATGTTVNTGLVVKMGAAAFLGAFYYKDAEENEEYAKKTRAIANTLPGKGDCNPITQKACYCSQPETQNDPTYCAAELHKKAMAQGSTRVSCVDSNLKADPNCNCERSNNCFEKFMLGQDVNNELGFAMTNGQFSPVKKLTNGEATGGVLSGATYGQYNAIAKKKLNDFANSIPGPASLSPNERKLAAIYQNAGIPGTIAAHMASANVPQAAINNAMAKVGGLTSNAPIANIESGNNRVVEFSGGSGLMPKGKSKNGGEDFSNLLGAKKGATANNKVIEFAVQKAQAQSQISKSDNRSIFEIISNRYLNSAAERLDLENKGQ